MLYISSWLVEQEVATNTTISDAKYIRIVEATTKSASNLLQINAYYFKLIYCLIIALWKITRQLNNVYQGANRINYLTVHTSALYLKFL